MAENVKISELTEISSANLANNDLLALVDVSANQTKKVTLNNLQARFKGEKGDKGDKGNTGNAAIISAVTASVNDSTGTPSVTVTTGGTAEAMTIDFNFQNLKGAKGDTGSTPTVTGTASVGTDSSAAANPTCTVSTTTSNDITNYNFAFNNIVGPKGDKGDAGSPGTAEQFTFVVDSDAKLNSWRRNEAGYDYTSVLIKKGTWNTSIVNPSYLSTSHTVRVVGETGSVINLAGAATGNVYGLCYNALDSTTSIEGVTISFDSSAFSARAGYKVYAFYNCHNISNCKVISSSLTATGSGTVTLYGMYGCENINNCTINGLFVGTYSYTSNTYTLYNCKHINNVSISQITLSPDNVYALYGCSNVNNANINLTAAFNGGTANDTAIAIKDSQQLNNIYITSSGNNNIYTGVTNCQCLNNVSIEKCIQEGFYNCTYLTNCRVTDSNIKYAFDTCYDLNNCKGNASMIGFTGCYSLSNCNGYSNNTPYYQSYYLNNCYGECWATSGQSTVYKYCYNLFGCSGKCTGGSQAVVFSNCANLNACYGGAKALNNGGTGYAFAACYSVNHCGALSVSEATGTFTAVFNASYSSPTANSTYACANTLNGGWNDTTLPT